MAIPSVVKFGHGAALYAANPLTSKIAKGGEKTTAQRPNIYGSCGGTVRRGFPCFESRARAVTVRGLSAEHSHEAPRHLPRYRVHLALI